MSKQPQMSLTERVRRMLREEFQQLPSISGITSQAEMSRASATTRGDIVLRLGPRSKLRRVKQN